MSLCISGCTFINEFENNGEKIKYQGVCLVLKDRENSAPYTVIASVKALDNIPLEKFFGNKVEINYVKNSYKNTYKISKIKIVSK